jgi:hypothetical protein
MWYTNSFYPSFNFRVKIQQRLLRMAATSVRTNQIRSSVRFASIYFILITPLLKCVSDNSYVQPNFVVTSICVCTELLCLLDELFCVHFVRALSIRFRNHVSKEKKFRICLYVKMHCSCIIVCSVQNRFYNWCR